MIGARPSRGFREGLSEGRFYPEVAILSKKCDESVQLRLTKRKIIYIIYFVTN